MSSSCPTAPPPPAPVSVETALLPADTVLFRCHKAGFPANSFNPNVGKHIEIAEEGARFNPFPGAPAANIPTIYAADSLEAAALESIFHDVPHVPSPSYPRLRLGEWSYSELKVTRDLVLLELVNPKLRQFLVPGPHRVDHGERIDPYAAVGVSAYAYLGAKLPYRATQAGRTCLAAPARGNRNFVCIFSETDSKPETWRYTLPLRRRRLETAFWKFMRLPSAQTLRL